MCTILHFPLLSVNTTVCNRITELHLLQKESALLKLSISIRNNSQCKARRKTESDFIAARAVAAVLSPFSTKVHNVRGYVQHIMCTALTSTDLES